MAKSDNDLYVAIETGVILLGDGREFEFHRGLTKVHGDHEARRRGPKFWELADDAVTFGPDGRRYSPQ